MGKKKSAVLIILFTIVLAGVLFLSITPTFPVKSPYSFRSLLSIVDLGKDLDGGYYTVYYPEGVISKAEYETLKAEYDYVLENTEEGKKPSVDNPEENYKPYKGLYLSTDIYSEETGVTKEFKEEFEQAYRVVKARYEARGLTDYAVRLQDDYTIRAEIPRLALSDSDSESLAQDLFTKFAYSGGLVFTDASSATASGTVEMAGTSEYIKGASTVDAGDSGYAVVIKFTKAGRAKFKEITGTLASSSSDSSSSSSGATLNIYMGGELLMGASVSEEMDQASVYITGNYTRESAETMAVVINSAIAENDIIDLTFQSPEYYSLDPFMGEYAAVTVAAVIGVLVLAMLIFSIVKFKGMGLAHLYGFLTYALAVIACISLISVIQITMGGILAILLASAIMVSCNYYAFNNIKKEFETGKTLTASVKSGYKKSLAFTIDLHAILLIAGLALYLIATGPVKMMGLVFTLCIALSAFCTLLVTRFCLYIWMAQPRNKIAFVGFKREETEDE